MEIHPDDKRKAEEELNDQIRPDSGELYDSDSSEERDLDDLVHKQTFASTKPDSEFDADDAVHQRLIPGPSEPGQEDPDDLVHGG